MSHLSAAKVAPTKLFYRVAGLPPVSDFGPSVPAPPAGMENLFSTAFDKAAIGMALIAPDSRRIRVNQYFCDMLGYTHEEYVGRPISEFHADDDVICDILKRLQAGEKLDDYPARLRCKDGSIKDVLIDSSVMFRDGEFVHTRCFTRDVSERRRAEESLRHAHRQLEDRVAERTAELVRANEFLDALLENVQTGVVACDAAGVLTLFNGVTRALHGLPEEPIPPEQWAERYRLYRPDGQTPMAKEDVPLYRALQGEWVQDAEMVIVDRDRPPGAPMTSIG